MVEVSAEEALKSVNLPVDLFAPLFGCSSKILKLFFQLSLLLRRFFMERRHFL
jgi:hypothetical protein